MATPKSPFYVVQEFISAKMCEKIVDDLGCEIVHTNEKNEPQMLFKHDDDAEDFLFSRVKELTPLIENYYNFEYRGTEKFNFEWYPEESEGNPICDNSNFLRKKWVRTKDRDFTGIIFLSDYQDKVPFDNYYEVYGGKLEFPQHKFGFNPQRGTLILFPSCPHFINVTSHINAGDLFQARFHIAAKLPYLYNPQHFPGDYRTWFTGIN